MARRVFRLNREGEGLFDIVSYGRRGPSRPTRFTCEQVEQIARTVRRVPEVMVKVSGGAKTTRGAEAHFQYISRQGELEVEVHVGGTGIAVGSGHGDVGRPAARHGFLGNRPPRALRR